MLLTCGKSSNTLTNPMVTVTFHQIITCISTEHDSSFLASLYKCFMDSLCVIGGPLALSQEYHNGIMEAMKRQLQLLTDRQKGQANHTTLEVGENDNDEMALLEEIEDFTLEDMGKMLSAFDANHPLLVAVSSVNSVRRSSS
ncbi:hypothetical protein L208DRAFT_1308477 [Tricholoma matsutake]|nr:hypothetical protein L208DRAFT_1308477 [Tricholoma matsutake 945]